MANLKELLDNFRYRAWPQSILPYPLREAIWNIDETTSSEEIARDRLGRFLERQAQSPDSVYKRLGTSNTGFDKSARDEEVERYRDLYQAYLEERESEKAANTYASELIAHAIEVRTASHITENELNDCFAWGPESQFNAEKQALYKDRQVIDAAGGLEHFTRRAARERMLANIGSAVDECLAQEDWLKTMFRVCLRAETALDFPHLQWVLDEGARGRIAVISEAELRIATDRWFYLAGSKFEHPNLGKDDGMRDPSSRGGAGMTTTPLIAYWPEHFLARTVSRFYLLPNEIKVLPRHREIMTVMEQMGDESLLTRALADDTTDQPRKSHKYREDMAGRIQKAFISATEHVTATASSKDVQH